MKVLVIGLRQGLNKALEKMGIEYVLLLEHQIKYPPKNVDIIYTESLPKTKSQAEKESLVLKGKGLNPTHIIAATESAVFSATLLRHFFECRISQDSVIKKCTRKSDMKIYLSQKDIPMGGFIPSKDKKDPEEIVKALSFPIVVKEISNSGSRGMKIAYNLDDLKKFMGKDLLYESFIEGREGSIESFVNHKKILFSSMTEYYIKKHSNIVPAGYDEEIKKEILNLNQTVIKKLRISWGLAHMEYYLSKQGLLFGEIALRPPGGYIMNLINLAYDFDPWEAFISVELDLEFSFPSSHTHYAGCYIYHTGQGSVEKIRDVSVPSLYKNKIKVGPGDSISQRVGVGEDLGYCLLRNSDISLIKNDIDQIESDPPIQLL